MCFPSIDRHGRRLAVRHGGNHAMPTPRSRLRESRVVAATGCRRYAVEGAFSATRQEKMFGRVRWGPERERRAAFHQNAPAPRRKSNGKSGEERESARFAENVSAGRRQVREDPTVSLALNLI